jgi:ribose/xylose/arabinose/galactoside ABC-type transport system permease subunit
MDSSAKPSTRSDASGFRGTFCERTFLDNYGVLVFFLLLIAVSAFFTPNFLATTTLVNTLVQAFPVMLVALGMTLVMSSGGIDISVGAIMAISGAVAVRLYTANAGLVPAVAGGILAGGLCGLFNGTLIAKFKIQPIIVTLVVMIAGRGLAQTILGKPEVTFSFTSFEALGLYTIAGLPIQIVILAVAVALMLFVVKRTVFAKHVEAIGDNPRAARLVGINILITTACVYVLCSVLCGIAGIMEAARAGGVNGDLLGKLIELDAIAAVAIGGTSFSGGRARIWGTVMGAVIVPLVTVIANMNNIPDHYSMIFKAIIVIAVLWVRPEK